MNLKQVIERLEKSKGYIVMVTTFNPEEEGKELKHYCFKKKFPISEYPSVMFEQSKLLSQENKPTSFKK